MCAVELSLNANRKGEDGDYLQAHHWKATGMKETHSVRKQMVGLCLDFIKKTFSPPPPFNRVKPHKQEEIARPHALSPPPEYMDVPFLPLQSKNQRGALLDQPNEPSRPTFSCFRKMPDSAAGGQTEG